MHRPLGCLTGLALITAGVAVVVLLLAAAMTGNGIFSPGALSATAHSDPIGGVASHAELEGRCESCHPAAWSAERMADRCLACHVVVAQEIASGGGLHGRFAVAGSCRGCHTDHRGATAALTLADPRDFPHERTGYSLRGHPLKAKTGGIGCLDCHPGSPVTFTPPACVACHRALDAAFMAPHEATFGTVCLNCHDGVDTYGKAFNHATYALLGAHEQAPCSGCHRGATTLAAVRTAPTECAACHAAKDIHEGRLGTACGSCHTVQAWAGASIDHDRTRFALTGRHIGGVCESCHVNRQWTGISQTCRGCHATVDPHAGQFPGDCAACHVATGWKNVTFDHSKTRFALVAAHAKPACAACHAGGRYVGTPTTCIGCHAKDDRHKGAFGTGCASCHKTTAWLPATFDHTKSKFPLTGAHRSVTCQRCHAGGQFKGTPTTCVACHTRPSSHGSAFSNSCRSCHTTKAWLPASFNHDKASFPLTGAHRSVTCQRCHTGGRFNGTPSTCVACHRRPSTHGTGFSNSCGSCHTTRAWKPATFRGHTFPISHRGAGGVCSRCHPSSYSTYSCARCHSNSSMTSKHHDVSGFSLTTCAKCHPRGQGGDD